MLLNNWEPEVKMIWLKNPPPHTFVNIHIINYWYYILLLDLLKFGNKKLYN